MHNFGERLREERQKLGLSQREFAESCGVTLRSQQNYEKGGRRPDGSYLNSAADRGADIGYILTGVRTILPAWMTEDHLSEYQELLDIFWGLSDRSRKTLKLLADALHLADVESGESRLVRRAPKK